MLDSWLPVRTERGTDGRGACVIPHLMDLRKLRNLKVAATKSLNSVLNYISPALYFENIYIYLVVTICDYLCFFSFSCMKANLKLCPTFYMQLNIYQNRFFKIFYLFFAQV